MTFEAFLAVVASLNGVGVFGLAYRFWRWTTRVEVRLAVIEAHTSGHGAFDSKT